MLRGLGNLPITEIFDYSFVSIKVMIHKIYCQIKKKKKRNHKTEAAWPLIYHMRKSGMAFLNDQEH